MKRFSKIFSSVDAVCHICGTPLGTPNDRKIGDNYYCADDYEREKEKHLNRRKKRENQKVRDFLGEYDGS
jgi:hypothetical protein